MPLKGELAILYSQRMFKVFTVLSPEPDDSRQAGCFDMNALQGAACFFTDKQINLIWGMPH